MTELLNNGSTPNWTTGRQQQFNAPRQVMQVRFSPKGERIAAAVAGTASIPPMVRLWQVNALTTPTDLPLPSGTKGWSRGIDFHPTENWILACSQRTAVLLDIETKKTLQEFGPHKGEVMSCVISPDGKMVATTSRDGLTRLWRIDGTPMAQLDQGAGVVWRAAFNRKGTRLVTVGMNARIWIPDTDELLRKARARLEKIPFTKSELEPYRDRLGDRIEEIVR